ncbi:hypothetical protein F4778DRAFT_390929 [Xylariomycetidae sp. FL2044]|nr:hypothetical protein F4778DRAFT_390929 [Xylariomycetidae sp. FL2044]
MASEIFDPLLPCQHFDMSPSDCQQTKCQHFDMSPSDCQQTRDHTRTRYQQSLQERRRRVFIWLQSVDNSEPPLPSHPDHHHRPLDRESPLKRARFAKFPTDSDETYAHPYHSVPNSPPLTEMPSTSRLPPNSKKRTASILVDDESDAASCISSAPPTASSSIRTSMDPPPRTKRRSAQLDFSSMSRFKKPVYPHSLPGTHKLACDLLPREIRTLYIRLNEIKDHLKIVPSSIEPTLRAREEVVRPWFLCTPDCEANKPQPEAEAQLATLDDILQNAQQCKDYDRNESAWNTLVNIPMLATVFSAKMPDPSSGSPVPESGARVRFEDVTTAAIVGNHLPVLQTRPDDTAPLFPCSVSSASDAPSAQTPSIRSQAPPGDLSLLQSRSSSKKVDFVLLLDLAESTPLQKTITTLVNSLATAHNTLPHVNHSTYKPLQYHLMAVSMETKKQPTDPLLQLAIWIASWNDRMYYLRGQLNLQRQNSPSHPLPNAALVPVPLLQAVGHNWSIYFVCDSESSIRIHGPFPIGSTDNLISLYALEASLIAIRKWVLTDFRVAMEAWFMPES